MYEHTRVYEYNNVLCLYIKLKELKLWSLFTLLLALFNVLEIKYFFTIVIETRWGVTADLDLKRNRKRFMFVFDVFNSNKHQVNSFVGKQSVFIF